MNIGSSCLVTGASGFIGRVLCAQLRQRGVFVRGLFRRETIGPWDECVTGDLSSEAVLHDCLLGMDTLFHLAGKAHSMAETVAEVSDYQEINVAGTKRLLEAAERANVRRFIFFSSVKADGEGGATVLDETSTRTPETPYGRSKLSAENLVLNATGIPHVAIVRPTMVYGPANPGNLGRMILAIHKGFFPNLPAIPNHRSMIHVDDVAQAAILVAGHPQAHKQIYILTDGQAYSTHEIYEWICQALERQVPNWSIPLFILQGLAKLGDGIGALRGKRFMFDSHALAKLVGSAAYSSAKIQRELGFIPKWSLDQALPSIVQSILQK